MEAKPSSALVAARGKEGVKGLALYVRGHSGAVIGKNDLDVVMAARPRRDRDRSGAAVGEGVVDGIEEQVGQDLAVRARITVDPKALRHVDRQLDRRPLQDRP